MSESWFDVTDIVGKILGTNMTYTVVQQGPDPANHLLSGLEKNMPWWPKSAGSITKREGSWMLPPRAQLHMHGVSHQHVTEPRAATRRGQTNTMPLAHF